MKRIIAGILSGVLVVTSLAACSSNAYVKTQDKEGNGKIKGASTDKQYTAVLDMSGFGSNFEAWEVKYNPKNYKVGSDWKMAVGNNGGDYIDFMQSMESGKSFSDFKASDWLMATTDGSKSVSDLDTSTGYYAGMATDSVAVNLGDVSLVSEDEVSEAYGKGKETTFLCIIGALPTGDGSEINCLIPLIYDAGDGAYLYEPTFKSFGVEITDKNSKSSTSDTVGENKSEGKTETAVTTAQTTQQESKETTTAGEANTNPSDADGALADIANTLASGVKLGQITGDSGKGYIHYSFTNNFDFPVWFDVKTGTIDGKTYDASELFTYLAADKGGVMEDGLVTLPVEPKAGMVVNLVGDIKDSTNYTTVAEGVVLTISIKG